MMAARPAVKLSCTSLSRLSEVQLIAPVALVWIPPQETRLAIERVPLLSIESAEMLEVAVPATVVVARYRFPPAFRKAHWLKPAPEERTSWEAVAEAGFKSQVGVGVPMPMLPLPRIRI